MIPHPIGVVVPEVVPVDVAVLVAVLVAVVDSVGDVVSTVAVVAIASSSPSPDPLASALLLVVVAAVVVNVVGIVVVVVAVAVASQSIFPTKVAFSPWYFKFLPTVSAFSLLAFPHGTPEQHPVVPEQDPKCKELSSAQCSTTVPQLLVENAPPG